MTAIRHCCRSMLQLCKIYHHQRQHNCLKLPTLLSRQLLVRTAATQVSGVPPKVYDVRQKTADATLYSLTGEIKDRFACLQLAHAKLMLEYGEDNIEANPTPEAWLCALENIHPQDDITLIEYFAFLNEKREEMDEQTKRSQLQMQYDKLQEDENKILLISRTAIARFCHGNMAYAMMHGPHIVLDMSFGPLLGSKHPRASSRIVEDCLRTSKSYRQPFHIHICGVPGDRTTKDIDVMGIDRTPVTISSTSYLEHYPKEKLVYLTSDAEYPLEKFSADDVYVIGALAPFIQQRLTYYKAKTDGIRMARLPLELANVKGRTDLAVSEVLEILLVLAESNNDWKKAFSNIATV